VEKGPDAFRTISEVADDLELPQHVLRFWETRFAQIRPMKRGGGRRYYRPEDVDLLRGIRHLLYDEGYTINGVQRILRERGVRQVQAVGRAVANAEVQPDFVQDGSGKRASGNLTGVFGYLPSLRAPHMDSAPDMPRGTEAPAHDLSEDDPAPIPFRSSLAAALPSQPAADEETQGIRVSPDAARILSGTLQELAECRRLLDAAREEKS
jgi:DNA-binding transcriptional MerR regulator